MSTDMLVINADKVVHETIDDEVIIINLDTGTYYSLVETGVDVWQALQQGVTRPSLYATLARHYELEPASISVGLDRFIEELLVEEILVTRPAESDGQDAVALGGHARPRPFTPPSLARYTNMSDLLLLDPIHDVNEQGWPNRRIE